MSTPTFYVADPFPVYRLGLKNLLGAQFRNWGFAEFASYPALLAVLQNGVDRVLRQTLFRLPNFGDVLRRW